MIIVLEGIDGAGKTSLAIALAERWAEQGVNTWYVHNGASNTPALDYTNQALQALEFSHKSGLGHVVIDRFNVGEQVYPHTRRDGVPKITPVADEVFVQVLAQLGVRWLILAPTADVAFDRLATKAEAPDFSLLQRERNLFIGEFEKHSMRWPANFKLVLTEYTTEELVELALGDWS